MLIRHIIAEIERFAPATLQEDWDNTGMQVGDVNAECTGVLICLDVTPQIVAEAAEKGCNLVVSHHPMLFRGIKRVSDATPTGRCLIDAIKVNVAVYSCHTSIDSTKGGVSYALAESLGATVVRALHPADESLMQLHVFAPRESIDEVAIALADIDLPRAIATNAESQEHELSYDASGLPVLDVRHRALTELSLVVPSSELAMAQQTLDGAGGDVSYTIAKLDNRDSAIGLGAIARFDKPISAAELVARIKTACGTPTLRCNATLHEEREIQVLAVCGGAGGEFIADAARAGADAYVTADIRYHEFGEWADRIMLIDAGHYETEKCTKSLFMRIIKEKFANFAVYISETEMNPINYV